MTSKITSFILGTLVGVAAYALLCKSTPVKETTVGADNVVLLSNEVVRLQGELTNAKARLEKANTDNDELAAAAQKSMQSEQAALEAVESSTKKQPGLAALFGGDGTNGMSGAMNKMMKAAMERQMDAKLAAMKAKLNLTPEQEAAIREILRKQMEQGVEQAQKMMSGKMSAEEVAQAGNGQMNAEEQIKALLTPEQLVAYEDYQTEEKARMARLAANAELMQMQSTLQLTVEQQDRVFPILFDLTQQGFDSSTSTPGHFDFRNQMERKVEALRGVLTEEQLQSYQRFLQQQMEMIEAFMPGLSGSNNSASPTASP